MVPAESRNPGMQPTPRALKQAMGMTGCIRSGVPSNSDRPGQIANFERCEANLDHFLYGADESRTPTETQQGDAGQLDRARPVGTSRQ